MRDVDATGGPTPRLRFGLALDWSAERMPLDALFREYLPLIQLAERHGFESVWVGQHFPTLADELSHPPSPLLVLAALAPHTSMTLGTGVLLLPMWNPITLAYEAAVLDQLCGGRLIVGVGIGRPRDWRKFGLPREVIGQRTDEMLEALRALWSGADGYAGSVITCPGAIWPRPTQPQGPPLFVGGSIGRAIRRAARLGDGWYAGSTHLLSAIAETTERYRSELVAAGKEPAAARVAANRSTVIAETREQAWQDGGPSLEQLMHTYRKIGGTKTPDGRELTPDTEILPLVAEENCLLGTPDEVTAQLERYVAAGVTDVTLRVAPSDMPLAVGRRSIELAGRHIIPRFQ